VTAAAVKELAVGASENEPVIAEGTAAAEAAAEASSETASAPKAAPKDECVEGGGGMWYRNGPPQAFDPPDGWTYGSVPPCEDARCVW